MLFIINDNIRSPPLHSIKNSCTQSTHDCLCPGQVVQRMDKAGEMKAWRHQGEWDRAALGTPQPELHPLDARYEALTHDPRSLSKTPSKTQLNPLPPNAHLRHLQRAVKCRPKAFAVSHNIRKDSLVPKLRNPCFSSRLVAKGKGAAGGCCELASCPTHSGIPNGVIYCAAQLGCAFAG